MGKEFAELDVNSQYCGSRHARLFYVWGHSFEFAGNDNWSRLTELCEVLAHKEDVWYATNIEIYEYVTAYHSLVYSADGSRVYNPTLKEIWFDNDGTLCRVKPGETVEI